MTEKNSDAALVEAQKEIVKKVDAFFELKNLVSDKEKELKAQKKDLLEFMENSNITRLEGTDCKLSVAIKATPSMPKDAENKQKLFGWIKENKGEDVLLEMLTFNSRSFGSFYNAEELVAIESGDLEFSIDGVSEPHNVTTLRVNKK